MMTLLTTSLILYVGALSSAQDAPGPGQTGPDLAQDPETQRAFYSRDWMIGVAGNDVILRSDLDYQILADRALSERFRRGDDAERNAVYSEALGKRLETLLHVQAGMDLGFDEKLVDQLTGMNFKRRIEEMGGPREASKLFKQEQLSPDRFREQIKDRLLATSWYRSQTGQAEGPTGRASIDRYVRPGLLHSTYQAFCRSPLARERAVVGAVQARYELQVLRVPIPPDSTLGDTRELALELRRMYESEEVDFDFLVRTYGDPASQEKLGRLDPLPRARLADFGRQYHGERGQDLLALLDSGRVGGTTEPLFRQNPDSWYVYRLVDVLPETQALPLASAQTQGALRRYLLENLDRTRAQNAFATVLQSSFVFPREFAAFLAKRNQEGK